MAHIGRFPISILLYIIIWGKSLVISEVLFRINEEKVTKKTVGTLFFFVTIRVSITRSRSSDLFKQHAKGTWKKGPPLLLKNVEIE